MMMFTSMYVCAINRSFSQNTFYYKTQCHKSHYMDQNELILIMLHEFTIRLWYLQAKSHKHGNGKYEK